MGRVALDAPGQVHIPSGNFDLGCLRRKEKDTFTLVSDWDWVHFELPVCGWVDVGVHTYS